MSYRWSQFQGEHNFRTVYATDQKARAIRLMAVGHRRYVHEDLTDRLRRKTRE